MNLPTIRTPMIRLQWPGKGQIWVKDEGCCPTGTFKDRLAWRLTELLAQQDDTGSLVISCITLGNTALSLAVAFESAFPPDSRPHVLGVFPNGFAGRTIGPDNRGHKMIGETLFKRLENHGVTCIEHDLGAGYLSEEELFKISCTAGLRPKRHQDVSRGIPVPSYEAIVSEAIRQLNDAIDFVVVPVGAGVLFDEAVQYISRRGLSTRVLGVTTTNPHSIADKIYSLYSPYAEEVLAGGTASHPDFPVHRIVSVNDQTIRAALSAIPQTLRAEPSAAAAFSVLTDQTLIPVEASVLVVNTGSGILS